MILLYIDRIKTIYIKMIPKGAKYGNKVFIPNIGVERVRELLDDTDPKTTFLPETISIIELDWFRQ